MSMVGKDEDAVREYIQKQEKEDKRIERFRFFQATDFVGST